MNITATVKLSISGRVVTRSRISSTGKLKLALDGWTRTYDFYGRIVKAFICFDDVERGMQIYEYNNGWQLTENKSAA